MERIWIRVKPRMRDIAAMVKVSPATASNALNGRGGVSKEVQAQIISIAREMGYQPNRETKKPDQHVRLILYKSHGQVIADTTFFSELIEAIQMECKQEGAELLINHIHAKEDADYAEQIEAFANEECAGIILLATEMNKDELQQFKRFHSPLIVLDNSFRFENVHAVVMNNVEAGYLAANVLYEAGHRQLEHITSSVVFSNTVERMRGFREGLALHGLRLTEEQVWPVRPSISGAYEDMKALIQQRQRMPEAFFAANDLMAIGCMRAITEAGYRVPEDVSILGMDDTSVCLACTPQLSTIRVCRKELGVTVVRTLLSLVERDMPCTIKTEIGVDVVMRDSVRIKKQ